MRRTPGLRLAFWLSFYRDRNAFYGSEDERCFSKLIVSFYKSIDQSSPTASAINAVASPQRFNPPGKRYGFRA
jgi:hypothetical protein